jgi:hypothetical protein
MNKQINFEDNFFALDLRLRMLRDILILDTDPELFRERTLGDLDFIDGALERLHQALGEHDRLFDRQAQAENISGLEWRFSRLLTGFLNSASILSAEDGTQVRGKLSLLRVKSEERQRQISHGAPGEEVPSSEPVVSGTELSELLKDL